MSSSELSELSSSPLTDDDEIPAIPKSKLEHYFKSGSSALPPKVKKKRAPSPPHEYVLADNPDIAFICIFRSRFSDALPKSLPHYGPQDIERGVVDSPPGEQVERLLCALLGLLLNRKKEVEKGHYGRALEEAVQAHKSQWAGKWEGKNPLHGGGSFNNMTPEQRLTLLKTLILWSMDSSDAVKAAIKESYKQSRHDDDLNQPLSVQSWGRDGEKRRYWLIEGQDDTHFRLYRESNPALKTVTWRSVAGDIDEVKAVATALQEEGSQAGKRLRDRIIAAVPRFEASEDKRKRRDYRLQRRAQFTRPEPGFSMYEGRTRGKRVRYTYSDEEGGGDSDALSTRRSNRQSGISTPAEPLGPTFTASGRQVKSRHGGAYGESMLSGQQDGTEPGRSSSMEGADEDDGEPVSRGRAPRAPATARPRGGRHIDGYNALDEMDDESDATSSGNEWDGGADDEPDDQADDDVEDDDIEMSDDGGDIAREDESDEEGEQRSHSLVVSLRYSKVGSSPPSKDATNGVTTSQEAKIVPARQDNPSDNHGAAESTPKTSLAPTVLPATVLTTISAIPSPRQGQDASVNPTSNLTNSPGALVHKTSEPPTQAPPLQSLAGTLAPPDTAPEAPAETLINPHAYIFDQNPQSPKVKPTPNIQQYQYQPPGH